MPTPGLPLLLDQSFLLDQPFHGLVLFTGHPSILRLSQLLCLQYLRRAHPVVLVDATNAYDPLLFSDAARAHRLGLRMLLNAIHLSRAYTCHQLEVLMTESLRPAIEALHPRAILCLGLLDLLDDEDVPATEAIRIFRRMLPALEDACRHLPILAACPDPAVQARGTGELRRRFCDRLQSLARWHFTARPEGGAIRIVRERPEPARWEWTPTLRPVRTVFRRHC